MTPFNLQKLLQTAQTTTNLENHHQITGIEFLIGLSCVILLATGIVYMSELMLGQTKWQKNHASWNNAVKKTVNIMPLSMIKRIYFEQRSNIVITNDGIVTFDNTDYRCPNYKQHKEFLKWIEHPIQPSDIEMEQLKQIIDKIYKNQQTPTKNE